jgi:LysR family transcriptional regulator (chromosome initiation inhibitor)
MKAFDPAGLDCLAALADETSFERAAQRLAVTQSAVSQRLRTLEAQVGQPLVLRTRPLRLTEPGKVLLRFARQLQAMRADVARELGVDATPDDRLAIAVNADSLATWVPDALDPLVQRGVSLELIVDDQDFTHDWLRQGAVLGCVSTVSEALRGCRVVPLETMHYIAAASPAFVERHLGGSAMGLDRSNFSRLPFLVFNRKDDMQNQWVSRAFGVRAPRLHERFVPASEPYLRAVLLGWGIGLLPVVQAQPALARGELVPLRPETRLSLKLYWHQWKLGPESTTVSPRAALLDEIGAALAAGARLALSASAR